MTREQIEQNARVYANKEYMLCTSGEKKAAIKDFIAGAHSRDEEIKELKEEIESLKENEKELFEGFKKRGTKLGELMKENVKLRNPWISVEERLPEDREKMFFRKKDGAKYYGWFDERMQKFLTIDPDCIKWTINGVTHWMPIPELKKGK